MLNDIKAPLHALRQEIASQYLRGEGIEIGALHAPLWVPEDVKVFYVDCLSVEQQREQYPELSHFKFVELDILDNGETLTTIADESFDFVILNHVIEHFKNPILSIENALRVIKPGGKFYLAVPHKHHIFDRDRPLTTIEHLVRDYTEGSHGSRREHFEEWVRLVEKVPEEKIEIRLRDLLDTSYSIHFHTWIPNSFLGMLCYCHYQLSVAFEIERFQVQKYEFICVLRKKYRKEELIPKQPCVTF